MADTNTPKPADDRNLVSVDENYEHSSEEEKLALFWQKNKGFIFAATGIFIVALLGLQGIDAMRRGQIAKDQAAYLDARAEGNFEAYAEANAGSPLGGAAALSAADSAYAEGEFANAITLYNKAAEALKGTAFAERARLGVGYAQAKSGDLSMAVSTWNNLATDTDASEGSRAEASYAAAVAALETEDDAAFSAAVERLESFTNGIEYTNRLRSIAPTKL